MNKFRTEMLEEAKRTNELLEQLVKIQLAAHGIRRTGKEETR